MATLAITVKPGVLSDDLPIRLAGYVQLSTGVKPEEGIIIFSLRAEFHKKHIGTEAFKMFLNNVWEHNPGVNTLIARVVEENIISAQGLISAGFSKQDSEDVTMYIPLLQQNVKAVLFKLRKEDFKIQVL
jgi:RimJ/RimL family protein N-acetyltransferase